MGRFMGIIRLVCVRFFTVWPNVGLICLLRYIAFTIELDVARYQRQVVQNPFMVDVTVPEAYRVPTTSSATAASNQNALGSMEDILKLV
jgi:hypothetical protein